MKENGLGLGSVLFIVFLILKLTNVIKWSWLWVSAPLWIPICILIIGAIIAIIVKVIWDIRKR